MMEFVPPPIKLSGIMMTPLVLDMKGKDVGLVSVKYQSNFRDFTAQGMEAY